MPPRAFVRCERDARGRPSRDITATTTPTKWTGRRSIPVEGGVLTANEKSDGRPTNVPVDRYRVFDYTSDPLKAATPFDAYLEFRGDPAFWSPVAGGFWVLTDASSIRDCFQDP